MTMRKYADIQKLPKSRRIFSRSQKKQEFEEHHERVLEAHALQSVGAEDLCQNK
jgi:hypothetical protein